MHAEIVIVADLWAREDQLQPLLDLLRDEAEAVHAAESGVRKFALHRDTDDPLHLVMIEAFADERALADHRQTEWYRRVMAELPELVTERRRTVLAPLGFGDSERGHLA
jgi:quinol monooxygenase YgiN